MTKSPLLFFIAPFYLVLFAVIMQGHMLLSSDVACLVNEANKILSGGKYVTDFFETNPPMCLYLYFPACLLAKFTSLDIIFSVRVYIFSLAFLSIGLSYHLLKRIIPPTDKIVFYFVFIMLFPVIFYLPLQNFGQREHILLMLTLPYFFAAVLELENQPPTPWLAAVIGLMAGLGFALKPFFLIPLCFIECYFIVKKRHLFAWIRIESVLIAGVLVFYFCSIVLYQPEYLKIMVPFTVHYYFGTREETWAILFERPAVIVCLVSIVFYVLFYKKNRYPNLSTVLFLALTGMMIAFIIPRAAWYYHVFPAFGLAMLLAACFSGQLVLLYMANKSKKILGLICLAAGIYGYSVYTAENQFLIHAAIALNPASTNQLRIFINSHPGKHSIYCFTTAGTQDCFPLVQMTDSTYGGRLPFFWWQAGISNASHKIPSGLTLSQLQSDKSFLIDSVADDLNRYQAKWIIVNYFNFGIGGVLLNDFIDHNAKFREAWRHYRYVTTLSQYWIYERVDSANSDSFNGKHVTT